MTILNLLDYGGLDDWPSNSIIKKDLYLWQTNLAKEINSELGEDWKTHMESAYEHYGNPGRLKKNPLVIARALKMAWDVNIKSTSLIS